MHLLLDYNKTRMKRIHIYNLLMTMLITKILTLIILENTGVRSFIRFLERGIFYVLMMNILHIPMTYL
jgi:hypothetical protein